MKDLQTANPKEHSQNIKSKLKEISEHIRKDMGRVDDPKAQALFEASAEVLDGLIQAFSHYENRAEEAWK